MMSWQSFIRSRIATFLLSVGLFCIMIFAAKILTQKYQIDEEIGKLEDQVQKIKKNNLELSYLIQYFNTPEYQEKAVREKLNLKKDGEYVVGLPQQDETVLGAQTQAGNSSNYKMWFNYFFSKPAK